MKSSILIFAVSVLHFVSMGQDTEGIKSFLLEQFEPYANLELKFSTDDLSKKMSRGYAFPEYSDKLISKWEDSLEKTSDPRFMLKIAQAHKAMNNQSLSNAWFKRASKMASDKILLYPDSLPLLETGKLISMESGDLISAIKYNYQVMLKNPDDTAAISLDLFLTFMTGQYDEGVRKCTRLINTKSEVPQFYLLKTTALAYRAMATINQLPDDEARFANWQGMGISDDFLINAQKAFPENQEIQLTVLLSRFYMFMYDNLVPILFNPPRSPIGYKFELSDEILSELANFEALLKAWEREKSFENKYAIHLSLGMGQVFRNNFKKAITYFENAIESKPEVNRSAQSNPSSAYENIIACYLFLGDLKSAKEWQLAKLEDKPSGFEQAEDAIALGFSYMKENNLKDAEKSFQRAIAIDSTVAEPFVRIAEIRLLQGNVEEAEKLINQAFLIDQRDVIIYKALILVSFYKGDEDTANYLLNDLLAANPEDRFSKEVKKRFGSKS